MRRFRWLVGVSFIASQIGMIAAGCGGDDKGASPVPAADGAVGTAADGSTTGTDGSSGSDSSSTTDSPPTLPTVTVNAADINVYLGQIAQLDASTSTIAPDQPVTYTWTMVSAPAGSAVNTTSIFNAGSARPTFTPDLAGDYVLKIVVSGGGASSEKNVTVKAFEAKVLYMAQDDAGAGGNARITSLRAVGTHSDGGTSVGCVRSDAGDPASFSSVDQLAQFYADIWEAPTPGQAARTAYVMREFLPDGGDRSRLFGNTADNPCPNAATILAELPTKTRTTPGPFGGSVTISAQRYIQPSISPDGARVAFLQGVDVEGTTINTVGFDGSSRRVLSPATARADGGLIVDGGAGAGEGLQSRPRWKNSTQLGFMTFPSTTTWNVMLVDDADGATPSVYMTCQNGAPTGSRPTQFGFLPDGSVVVSLRVARDAGASAQDLVIFTPDATTKACVVVRNLTNLPTPDGGAVLTAGDFSISPDGTTIAFVRTDPNFDAGAGTTPAAVWTAAVNGLTPPSPLPAAPARDAVTGHGPRWVAGGSMLVFSQQARSVVPEAGAGGGLEAVVLAPSGGSGDVRVLERGIPGKSTVRAIGNGISCGVAAAGGSGVVAFGATGAFVSLLLRRLRRRRDDRH